MSAFCVGQNDDQAEEIEVLNSIFPTEFESTSPNSFKIHLVPNPGGGDNHVAVALVIEMTPEYPISAQPKATIEVEKGLGKRHAEELQALVNEQAATNVGMPSVFVIAEAVKEWLADNNVPGQDGSMYAEMMRRMQQKDAGDKKKADKSAISIAADDELRGGKLVSEEEKERERRRLVGTAVTAESFMTWKTKFDAEMRALAEKSGSKFSTEIDNRPSGKQLFMTNKAGQEDALIAAGEEEDVSNKPTDSTSAEEAGDDDQVEYENDDDDDDDDSDYVPGDDDGEDDDDFQEAAYDNES